MDLIPSKRSRNACTRLSNTMTSLDEYWVTMRTLSVPDHVERYRMAWSRLGEGSTWEKEPRTLSVRLGRLTAADDVGFDIVRIEGELKTVRKRVVCV